MCKGGLLSLQGKIGTIDPDFPGKMTFFQFLSYFFACSSLKSDFLTYTKIIYLKLAILGSYSLEKFHNFIFKIVNLVST